MSIANPKLLAAGVVAFIIGWLLRGWASRNSLTDLAVDAAKGAAWDAVKNRAAPTVPDEVQKKLAEFQNEQSNVKRAQKAAGYAARHFIAQIVGVAGWIALLGGLCLGLAGVFWK